MMIMMIPLVEFPIGCYQSEINPKLYSLAFNQQSGHFALRALTGARAKTEAGEEATDADATAFCTTCCIYQKQTLTAKKTTMPFTEMPLQLLVLFIMSE